MILPIGKLMKYGFSILLLLCSQTVWANLSVTVDRTEITDADLLKLTVRVENTTTASTPNFRAIERDFEIIQRSGPNQSSRISIVNGRQTSEVYVSWELRLRPKRLGTLMIPAFRIGNEVSQPIPIQVSRQSEAMKRKMSQLVFFDTSVDVDETYVQGQILYTIKLYYVENISGDFPAAPAVEDAVVEVIEDERRYDAITNGRRYYVLEKRYGIYPQKSGELTIPPQTFSGFRVGPGFFSTREPVLTRSKSHTIQVKPKPAEFQGEHWLPASNVELEQNWVGGDPQFVVGEPINREITLNATGVATSLLPPLPDQAIAGAKTYQDPPVEEQTRTAEGVSATHTVVIGIVPTVAGDLTIPALEIPWWNTTTDSMEVARLPAQTFNVEPSPQSSPLPLQVQSTPVAPATEVISAPQDPRWQYAAIAFAVLWITTLIAWRVQSSRRETPASAEKVEKQFDTLKALKAACNDNSAGRAQQLLLRWGRETLGPVDSLQELTVVVDEPALFKEIQKLEDQLYSAAATGQWSGSDLWKAVSHVKQKPASTKTGRLTSSINPTSNTL